MKTFNELQSELQGYYGSEQMTYLFNKNSVYTDGFKHFLNNAGMNGAYWLYDIIQTSIYDILRKNNVLDVFYLTVETNNKNKCIITLVDYNDVVMYSRKISYTDLQEGKFTFICGWDGTMLTTCLISEN